MLQFSFDGIESAPIGITPVFGGTDHIYMTGFSYEKPAGKDPRLEIKLERREPGKKVEKSTFWLGDWTLRETPLYPNQPEDEPRRMMNIFSTYRSDLTDEQLKDYLRGLTTWEAVCEKVKSLLPPNYDQLATTWYLRYRKGQDILEIPSNWTVVRMGNGKSFKMDPKYDFMVPQKQDIKPTPAHEFSGEAPVEAPDDLPF
ncbi:hypothetical protein CLV58_109250 [Spirosoma oryzae]|uniref:Uncharacterized protein n=1 Tax=Spirosoma oryzae TaxID=1469603 RepID=A0A2T0SYT3_9BACT|nr:hypothetical protein [Spirosoma oryzae]PRY38523.1 hypothetical protein CLV58_109250 [Spirosoma oryzae]